MKVLTIFLVLLVSHLIIVEARISSRQTCEAGDNEFCEKYDYEGACCAQVKVTSVSDQSTAGESNGNEFLRCYAIDDVIKAFDNGNKLEDNTLGGSLNTYEFKCTEKKEDVINAVKVKITWAISILVLGSTVML